MPPIAQYVFNGMVTGGILALPAVAFSLLWRLLRFPNFAVSTYLTWARSPPSPSTGASAGPSRRPGWRPGHHGRRGPGRGPRGLSAHAQPPALRPGHRVDRCRLRPGEHRPLRVGERLPELRRARDPRHELGGACAWGASSSSILAVAVILMLLAQIFLVRTRLGIAMRATAENPIAGQHQGRPHRAGYRAGHAGRRRAGRRAGVFLGLDANVDPLMGAGLIISVFAAAILGGIGSAPGALAGALIVGLVEELGRSSSRLPTRRPSASRHPGRPARPAAPGSLESRA